MVQKIYQVGKYFYEMHYENINRQQVDDDSSVRGDQKIVVMQLLKLRYFLENKVNKL